MSQLEVCARIDHALATAPIHDHLGYEALAYLKLPGPDYKVALRALHMTLRPKTYVEIGVRDGDTLKLAAPDTWCAAIDPNPTSAAFEARTGAWAFYNCKSDDFFASVERADRIHSFDLAFIDDDHSYAQARRDFENLERYAGPKSIICLHDVIPMDERTAKPQCQSSFWTGDVWKLMAEIVLARPDLVAFTVACPPTGLGIVGKFSGVEARGLPESKLWPMIPPWDQLAQLLNIVPNNPAEILRAFNGGEVAA